VKHDETISELANALQVAAPLATTLRRDLDEIARHAFDLEAAVDRAVRAVRRLRPDTTGGAQ